MCTYLILGAGNVDDGDKDEELMISVGVCREAADELCSTSCFERPLSLVNSHEARVSNNEHVAVETLQREFDALRTRRRRAGPRGGVLATRRDDCHKRV